MTRLKEIKKLVINIVWFVFCAFVLYIVFEIFPLRETFENEKSIINNFCKK